MKKIAVLAGSNSKKSINKELAVYAASLLKNVEIDILDLNNFEVPLYGMDEETENGIPKKAIEFLENIHRADGIILSLAEHNGNFSAAFKNIYDWSSRIEPKLWNNIPMLLMATSPGSQGGASVLAIAKNGFPYMGGNIVADFSLSSFYDNFKAGILINEDVLILLKEQIQIFHNSIQQ
ncbi:MULTISPECIES: NADPH-dependent FMN reductase [unclassified Polaribacter]|uniref:NADPH-dependent FMN reductase n=1 Tax=unclassified Polaribacter TaxID=196858 RepID=UPI0011BE203A|nr:MULTISPECIES: NAD(P)H-dependent oxidoreductase [unclassified Polaribacter]TXD51459.1 NAD(P)H-dependent oxidoreductase [Polaribacter sp. IC063]TXD61813.1 NAD(P)H-dependent oxidoreductase [Polaribacter sp. IC066]